MAKSRLYWAQWEQCQPLQGSQRFMHRVFSSPCRPMLWLFFFQHFQFLFSSSLLFPSSISSAAVPRCKCMLNSQPKHINMKIPSVKMKYNSSFSWQKHPLPLIHSARLPTALTPEAAARGGLLKDCLFYRVTDESATVQARVELGR